MTVAITVLTLGLAVAALAGIPAFVDNTVGGVVTIVGFAIAVVGLLLVLLAIPSQRKANQQIRRDKEFEVRQLAVERARLLELRRDIESRLMMARVSRDAVSFLSQQQRADGPVADLERESIDINAQLAKNANELRRLGADI
jgi:hypothetical protein